MTFPQQHQPLPFQPVQPQAPGHAQPRPYKGGMLKARRRVFFWIFIALQAIMLIFTVANAGSAPGAGCTGDCAAATETSQGQNLLDGIELWAGLDVIVFTCWAAWKLGPRA